VRLSPALLLVACSAGGAAPLSTKQHDAGTGGVSDSGHFGGQIEPGDSGADSGGSASGLDSSADSSPGVGGSPAGGTGGAPEAGPDAAPDAPAYEQCPGPEWEPYGPEYWTVLELAPGQCVQSERAFSGNLVQYAHSLPDGRCYSVAVSHMRVQTLDVPLTLFVHFNGAVAESDRRIIPCT
jgi:hypothetical protein